MLKLLKNAASCRKCNTLLESKSKNDIKKCVCGNVTIEGGLEYARFLVKDAEYWEPLHDWLQTFPENDDEKD